MTFGETRLTGETEAVRNRMDSTISPAPVHGEGVLVFGHGNPEPSGSFPGFCLPETPPRNPLVGDAQNTRRETAGPDPDCPNCDGRGCMGCIFREHPHECANDCPTCCGPSPDAFDLGAPEREWRSAWDAWAAETSDLTPEQRARGEV